MTEYETEYEPDEKHESADAYIPPYDFEFGYWHHAMGEEWSHRGEKWYSHWYLCPVRCFEIIVDTCQGFNKTVGETTTMHAVLLEAVDRTTDPDEIRTDYPCATAEFTTARAAHEYAAELMERVDAGEFDDAIIDPLAMGRAKHLANCRNSKNDEATA